MTALVITSASAQHFAQIRECLAQRKAVFVEKPIAGSLSEIDALYALAQRQSVAPIFVGYQRRFDAQIRELRRLIHEENALQCDAIIDGLNPNLVGGIEKMVSTSKDPNYPPIDYVTASLSAFHDSVVHDIDAVCFVSKQFPIRVFAAAHAHFEPIAAVKDFDRIFVTLQFANGMMAMVDWCRRSAFGYEVRIDYDGFVEKYDGFEEKKGETQIAAEE